MEPIRRVFTFRITNPILSGLLYSFLDVSWRVGIIPASMGRGLAEDDLSFYVSCTCRLRLYRGCVSGKRAGNKGWYYGA